MAGVLIMKLRDGAQVHIWLFSQRSLVMPLSHRLEYLYNLGDRPALLWFSSTGRWVGSPLFGYEPSQNQLKTVAMETCCTLPAKESPVLTALH